MPKKTVILFFPIFPFKAILIQLLFLVLEIAIHTWVFQSRLQIRMNFTPRKSVEYAITLTLLATVVGWLIFFWELAYLFYQPELKNKLIIYILFNEWSEMTLILLFVGGLATFFITLSVKLLGFRILEIIRGDRQPQNKPTLVGNSAILGGFRRRNSVKSANLHRSPYSTILMAHAWSYSTLLIILLLLNNYVISGWRTK